METPIIQRLIDVRKLSNLTQTEFSEKLGLNRAAYAHYESGKASPEKLADKLSARLNVNPTWYLTGEGQMFLPSKESQSANPKATIGTANWVRPSHSQSIAYNLALRDRLSSLQMRCLDALATGTFTWQTLKAPTAKPDSSLLAWFDKFIELYKAGNSHRWEEKYLNIKVKIERFLNGKDISLNHLDHDWLVRFRSHLVKLGNKPTTVQRNLSFLRTMLKAAIRHKAMEAANNPFMDFPLPAPKVNKERLTEPELQTLLKTEYQNPASMAVVRLFAFQFHTAGTRIGDTITLKPEQLQGNKLEYTMHKTGHLQSVYLNEGAKQSLAWFADQFPDTTGKAFVFPFLRGKEHLEGVALDKAVESATAQINRQLKQVAKEAAISKRLTTHMARHTFADLARKKGGNLYSISKALGHSNLKITENYLSAFDRDGVDDLLKMFE